METEIDHWQWYVKKCDAMDRHKNVVDCVNFGNRNFFHLLVINYVKRVI